MDVFSRLPARSLFRMDRVFIGVMILAALALAANGWIAAHPEHDPRAPLALNGPAGMATSRKLAALRTDPALCRGALERAEIAFDDLNPVGEGACRRDDRLRVVPAPERGLAFAPARPETTCAVQAAMAWWLDKSVQPMAEELLNSRVARIEQLGTYSCRRVNGADTGRWSEHATGNAIDIAAFVLNDGRRISVQGDWWTGAGTPDAEGAFLAAVRDGACDAFGTVLSPDYNALHADHFHLDQAPRGFGSFCR
ncbi:extensin family protein [uncultured Croceicoccus sp.]|uniref:extensin-like domain-containing protein n=1 Tax=uncultured Croceicoccus sp. TaxID=1295329 RepID=UPI002605C1BE|nr:extensin family protein [uncultured Croceicoccus sp.]